VGDPEAAERDLGFNWTVDLKDGMSRLIEWRENHKKTFERKE
jgi:UDP-glucose 4-epimerase